MITKEERKTLNEYLRTKIPNEYKILDKMNSVKNQETKNSNVDLMYCYEEIFDYTHNLLDGMSLNKNNNFIDVPSISFSIDFVTEFTKIGNTNKELKSFCDKLIEVFRILDKYAIK